LPGSLSELFAATVLFVSGHFALSSLPMRIALLRKLGETRFLVAYSAAMTVIFIWMILVFIDAPVAISWTPPKAFA
jgi:hypothetical protein